ncbi:hypothetical protein HGB07_05710 [Candidatus Roizmanbacteria bacterium]|nr:hypothetical protein [Candidatus Roizmanbacteria bacterium]
MNTQYKFSESNLNVLMTILLGIFFIFMVFARIDTYLKNQAVHDCAKTSIYTKIDAETKQQLVYPALDVYKNCLKDKGIK